ncbi:DCC1-like thiol-disulfide oxidoreductase family protein [Aequorivita sp. SDUM287046]|uniref:DCC1-like thiol-disulfide oxidoreductase family protein n=1 Tax=Aequorivita aurantiaca TaxID=3053356 RepID=A0ABT8DJA0_9FLAO|nr:DCC1-like thiol-disulfide oxidoreductase family protein [Aequorivita aurantiaca]MDN3725462.1 DCC1-like thiol-disulfide oxidoreductase family protein [Aequorivita aurantiaca]
MFSKIQRTAFPPLEKPMMVWDGECGFCKYWITHWKSKTADRLDYRTYQEVAGNFPDIPLKEFKKASRLIELDGTVYSGPDSAYKSFTYFKTEDFRWHRWYSKDNWFTWLSDRGYNFIAKHRSFMFPLSKIFFGKNPEAMKPYWFLELLFLFSIFYLLLKYL